MGFSLIYALFSFKKYHNLPLLFVRSILISHHSENEYKHFPFFKDNKLNKYSLRHMSQYFKNKMKILLICFLV